MPIKKVLYLVSDGTQYIDTGIIGKPGIDVELCVAFRESFSGWHFPIGSCYANANRSYLIGVNSLTTTTVQRGTDVYHDDRYSFAIGTEYVLKFTGTTFYINGSQICTVRDQAFTSPVSLYLFAANKNGEAWSLTPMALKYCKIWEDGILVRDFVPALNDSNVAGLYDNINNIFYESESGSFDYEVIPWSMGEDGYPTPANSETALPDYTFVKPLPRLLWHCSEITMDILPDLPSYALTEPLPRSMWRITARVENGYPYHELFPDLIRQSGAFENASRLSRVIIPESVKTIGDSAFQGTALTVVRVAADCTFGEESFPENCRILRYPAHTHGQLTDDSGRVVLDRQGRRIYARRIDNG